MLKKMVHNLKNCLPHITIRSRRTAEYDLIKHQLVGVDNGIVLWEIDFHANTSINPDSKTLWSSDFRRMLGFKRYTL